MTDVAPLPLTEFDPELRGFIQPFMPATMHRPMPKAVVMCFFPEVLQALAASGELQVIGNFSPEISGHPIYFDECRNVAVFHPGMTAPLAVHHMEQAIAAGGRAFISIGGAGALRPELALNTLMLTTSAVRDEGVSFHYAPPSREIALNKAAIAHMLQFCEDTDVEITQVKAWTTDALYRETPARIAARKAEGCDAVEMEAAGMAACAQLRNVDFAHFIYAGDDVSGKTWDGRCWQQQGKRAEYLDFAIEASAYLRDQRN